MSKIIYNRIKAVLAEKAITNRQLAEGLGMNEKSISHWTTNTTQPSIHTLFLIADYLKTDVRDLLVQNKKAPKK